MLIRRVLHRFLSFTMGHPCLADLMSQNELQGETQESSGGDSASGEPYIRGASALHDGLEGVTCRVVGMSGHQNQQCWLRFSTAVTRVLA